MAPQGQGNREIGAPQAVPATSICTATAATRSLLRSTLPRQGVMPNWGARLDPATIKAVALYVHSLGGGE